MDRPANLWQPVPGPYAAHGSFDHGARERSTALWMNLHRDWLIVGGIALGAALFNRRFRIASALPDK